MVRERGRQSAGEGAGVGQAAGETHRNAGHQPPERPVEQGESVFPLAHIQL